MIDIVIDNQTRLIEALDAGDVDGILAASRAIEAAVGKLRADDGPVARESLEFGLRQTQAARIRINYLSDWNRQKIDRLAEIRGQSGTESYGNPALRS